MATDGNGSTSAASKQEWMLYLTILLAGLLLLSDAYQVAHLYRWTAKLGVALVYSAFVLWVGKGRPLAYTSAGIVCAAVVATWVF